MAFSLDIRCHSEIGLVRRNNQDSGYVSPRMLVVADGMGGAAAGDLASTVAVRHVAKADERFSGEDSPDRPQGEEMLTVLAGAVAEANDELADLVAWDSSLEGMGTTFCGAMFSGTQLGIVHIGDSRGYLLRQGHMKRMTHDHSWVQSLIDEGRITPEEAAVHPHRSLLLKVLNGQPQHVPDTQIVDLRLGDRILFCSDGLCGLVDDSTIAEHLNTTNLDDVVDLLATDAHAGGGTDNITIVVAEVVEADPVLDTCEPHIIGAATTRKVPEHEVTAPLSVDQRSAAVKGAGKSPVLFDSEAEESMRYAPVDSQNRRRRYWLWAIVVLAVVIVVTGGIFGTRAYLNTQYYVGTDGNAVAIYQGSPESLAWVRLSHVAETTDVKTSDLPRYYRERVSENIRVSSLESARVTVTELRTGAQQCKAIREMAVTPPTAPTKPSTTPEISPSASSVPFGTPSAVPPSAAVASPSASGHEVDLPAVTSEDC
ncbi:PP2C family serine/threonine-protein phosphatase [Cutibacterium sp.]|uniref:PP2C family protein-serine/threonine phosphatase n=1 Tax=Cutibacterium sp. TaxID=1912221 RepID=UPI0026DB506F|nr:protein phosphatase 2C domain-containing protein [Cutibacterium sp.]MDO4412691.1 protein phosphatase 2C domain-containing protein [Cutibacterium sp.]